MKRFVKFTTSFFIFFLEFDKSKSSNFIINFLEVCNFFLELKYENIITNLFFLLFFTIAYHMDKLFK